MTTIKQLIEEYNGPRCEDYEPGCVVCQVWQEYDTLVAYQKDHAMEEDMRRLVNWMSTLPVENQITMMGALVKEKPERVHTDAVSNWAKHNASAVAAHYKPEVKPWVPDEQQIKATAEFNEKYPFPSGPGRGKSGIIKDVPGMKPTKLRKTRKYSTKGFMRKGDAKG